jgi:hypothetical protein
MKKLNLVRELDFNYLHRQYGSNIYCTDIDFLEFKISGNDAIPIALIESKSQYATLNFNRLQHKVQMNLSNNAEVPYFVVQYTTPYYDIEVFPMNSFAKRFLPDTESMSLISYIKLLYEMRELHCPDSIIRNLSKKHITDLVRDYKIKRLKSLEDEMATLRREINGK